MEARVLIVSDVPVSGGGGLNDCGEELFTGTWISAFKVLEIVVSPATACVSLLARPMSGEDTCKKKSNLWFENIFRKIEEKNKRKENKKITVLRMLWIKNHFNKNVFNTCFKKTGNLLQ